MLLSIYLFILPPPPPFDHISPSKPFFFAQPGHLLLYHPLSIPRRASFDFKKEKVPYHSIHLFATASKGRLSFLFFFFSFLRYVSNIYIPYCFLGKSLHFFLPLVTVSWISLYSNFSNMPTLFFALIDYY